MTTASADQDASTETSFGTIDDIFVSDRNMNDIAAYRADAWAATRRYLKPALWGPAKRLLRLVASAATP